MSEARVVFLNEVGSHCPDTVEPAGMNFRCVARNRQKGLQHMHNAGKHIMCTKYASIPLEQLGWDGHRNAPTFTQKIDCSDHCGWKGFIKLGRCVNEDGGDS